MRVVIAGAGNVGRSIAHELTENGHQVLIIERDPAVFVPDRVPKAEWLLADACELASLEEAQLGSCEVSIAATGDDKANLVHSLLAKTEFGVPRTVARINHSSNEWMFDQQWGVDIAVSTPRIMSALVEEAVTVGQLVRLFSLRGGHVNLVEIRLPESSQAVGVQIQDLSLPGDAVIVAIIRDGMANAPKPEDLIQADDELLLVCPSQHEKELEDFLERQ